MGDDRFEKNEAMVTADAADARVSAAFEEIIEAYNKMLKEQTALRPFQLRQLFKDAGFGDVGDAVFACGDYIVFKLCSGEELAFDAEVAIVQNLIKAHAGD